MKSSVKSLGKFFGVILSGCLMLAASGCVVMDPADEADAVEAEWADELLDEAVEDELQYETATEEEPEPEPQDLPDPFPKKQPGSGTGD
jgi:hypothetical protein